MTATRATALFDRLASVYDEVLPFFAGFAQQHMEWLAPVPGTRVLDLGAGRGALTAAALARGCRVTAVDCAPGMVGRLAAQYPQVHEARVLDVHRLDFPDDSFDLVCAGFVVHLLDDPAAAAQEIRRVLAPGGVFSVPGDVENAPEWEFYGALFRAFQPLIPDGQGRLSRPLDAERLLTAEGFTGLTAAGFTGISETAIEQRLPVPDADTFWDWGLSHGSRAHFGALPADARTEFQARVRAELSGMDPIVYAAGAILWHGTSPACPRAPGRSLVRAVEAEQSDLVRVDVLGRGVPLQEEAEESPEGLVAQFQGVERQWVRPLVPFRVGLHGPVACPVGRLEGERVADILRDAAVRREAQGAAEAALLPHRESEPVRDAVHRVQDHATARSGLQKVSRKFRRAVEHQMPVADQVHAGEAGRVRDALRRIRRFAQDTGLRRHRPPARENPGDQLSRSLCLRLAGRLQRRDHVSVRVRQ